MSNEEKEAIKEAVEEIDAIGEPDPMDEEVDVD